MAAATPTYSGRSNMLNRLIGNGAEPKYVHWGTGNPGNAANSDVALFAPSAESRATATSSLITTTKLADTYQLVATLTSLSNQTIAELSTHDSATSSVSTTVTGSLTSGATGSQVVASAAGWPGSGNFYAQIDNEVVVATYVDATHISLVSRGANGSTAASHLAGAVITLGSDGGAGAAGATSSQTATVGTGQGGACCDHANVGPYTLATSDSITFTTKKQLT